MVHTHTARLAFASLILAGVAHGASAQSSVTHRSVYTGASAAGRTLIDVMPRMDPRSLPNERLRQHNALPTGAAAPKPGASAGSIDGVHRDVTPDAIGSYSVTSIAPYTTARASATVEGPNPTADSVAVTSYPWRVTGTLSFTTGPTSGGLCSASLIGPGLLLTAAHCVYTFGTNSSAGWHGNFVYTPAQYDPNKAAPYGSWTFSSETIATSYYNGSDTCYISGISCNNDIALLVAAPNAAGQLPGNVVGWYSYAWNGYSYASSFGGASLSSITQLGYPVAFDSGKKMERTDGIGAYWTSGNLKNTILGTAMTGGASGGPWLVNFGASPTIGSGASLGSSAASNRVVGVTGWGFTTVGDNMSGASFFGQNVEFPNASYVDSHGVNRGAGNIGFLVSDVCSASFGSC